MMRNLTVAALAACLMVPAAATTQGTPRRPSTRPRVRVETGPFGVHSFNDNRGRIGVIVDMRADATKDKVGARIEAITPDGPADKAGLKVGDIITRFNNTSLAGASAEDEEDSGPGMKLIELARTMHDLLRKLVEKIEKPSFARHQSAEHGCLPGCARQLAPRHIADAHSIGFLATGTSRSTASWPTEGRRRRRRAGRCRRTPRRPGGGARFGARAGEPPRGERTTDRFADQTSRHSTARLRPRQSST